MQFYKILGSSDMIGNPVGFIEKLGEGVIEFVNEPWKGLIKGPKEFAGGIGKGVTSLVTGVVSAGFGSVSKITGSLYSIAKSATGEKEIEQQQAENLIEGVYGGVTGAGGEIFNGITGIFTKPIEGAQKDGVKGFFTGVGKGLLGGVASPFTAVLWLGNVLAEGVSNQAVTLAKGRLPQYGRFRHPRYINARGIIEPYNKGLAEAALLLREVQDGYYSKHTIKFFSEFPMYKKSGKEYGVLIITANALLYLKDAKTLLFKSELCDIEKCEVYMSGKDIESNLTVYRLVIYSRKEGEFKLESDWFSLIDKTYSILTKEKARWKRKKKLWEALYYQIDPENEDVP